MRRIVRFVLGAGLVLVLTGCSNSQNFLNSASPISDREANLYRLVLGMSLVVFAIVASLLVYNVVRFHHKGVRDDGAVPPQHYRQLLIESIYTGIPLILVVILFILTIHTMNAVAAPSKRPTDIQVHVIAHQWWWEFDYADLNIKTANELHIPANTTVHVSLDSADVVHSFWVPALSGKMDVIPGVTNTLWLESSTPGTYDGQCAEFCGVNHANMHFKVMVDTQQDFETWVANQQSPPTQPQTDLQQQGYNIAVNGICSSCHTIGQHPGGTIGPNLTHLLSRTTFAGSTFDLNEANLRRWLQDNQAMKPGNDMQNIHPTPDQINALIAYLTTLN